MALRDALNALLEGNEIRFTLLLASVGLLFVLFAQAGGRLKRLPPACAPPPDPAKPFVHFAEIASKRVYSEIMSFEVGGQVTIVLNSQQAVHELLEKRAPIYSGREPALLANIGVGNVLGTLQSNRARGWQKWKNTLHDSLRRRSADSFKPAQTLETVDLLYRLSSTPTAWQDHLATFATNLMLEMSYGWRSDAPETDVAVVLHQETQMRFFARMAPGSSVLEAWPALRHIPGYIAQYIVTSVAEARATWRSDSARLVKLYNKSRERSDGKSSAWSMVWSINERGVKSTGLSPSALAVAVQAPLQGGLDTTLGMLTVFVLVCINHGSTFISMARKELGHVVGGARLPTLDDELPYIKAVAKETLRWSRGPPMAIPHAALTDDVYKSYDIPKGAVVIPNIYALSRDERIYRDAHKFRPERWLDGSTSLSMPTGHFGYGLRACPGQDVAFNALVLTIARLLFAFDITPTRSFDEENLDNYATMGLYHWPKDVPAAFNVRSSQVAALIEREYKRVKPELEGLLH